MSPRATSHPAPITGHARVVVKTGATYVGLATYDGRALTGSMSLRLISNGVVEYRAPKKRTWPLHTIQDIWWDDD
jgi:hypothetical protein